MAFDTRDWYTAILRRRQRYVERADFRESLTVRRNRVGWSHLARVAITVVAGAVLVLILARMWLRY